MTTVFWLLLILAAALPDWFSVTTQNKALEYVFKPVTLVLIIGYAWWLRRNPYDAFQARFLDGHFEQRTGDEHLGVGAGKTLRRQDVGILH